MDPSHAGGGWTLIMESWYQSGLQSKGSAASGTIADALSKKGTPYKLSDAHINAIKGGKEAKFDMMATQHGFNNAYSNGNYEYTVVSGYTAEFTWTANMKASSTTTIMKSYRKSDDALAWQGNLECGHGDSGYRGINCYTVSSGSTNPKGGSGCKISMGKSSNNDWHHWYMGHSNTDTYVYICNGAQHSSSYDLSHVFWMRPSAPPSPSAASCKELLDMGASIGDGEYQITPIAGQSPITVFCDMDPSHAGGGWTLIMESWYQSGLQSKGSAASGTIADALSKKGTPYKLSDAHINAIKGGKEAKFDMMATQHGFNNAYSNGNYEYTVVSGYTAEFTWTANMKASSTTTIMKSYRKSDDALAWQGNLECGHGDSGYRGINCYTVSSGSTNPKGGSGCKISMGKSSNNDWHHWYMGHSNTDTYVYICNGAQHSSSYDLSHVFWMRPSVHPTIWD